MKKLLPLLFACILMLSGCKTAEGFLSMPDSPSADLPERPGFVSEESSSKPQPEESEQEEGALPERNMTFLDTDTPYLKQILTRRGDQKILGMTYGDGTYFALTKREKGYALTGYDTDGIGTFAGILEDSFTFPTLMGYADGYACLYSAEACRTFACKADSTYVRFNRGKTDSIQLYRGGYVHIRDGVVSFFGPQHQKAYATYTIPDGMTFLLGNEETALVSKQDGTPVQLTFSPDGMTENLLSSCLSYDGNAITVSAHGQTVLFNPYDHTLIAAPEYAKTLAAGKGYVIEEQNGGIRFVDTENGNTFFLPKSGAFRFGARTDEGFLFALGDAWYLLEDEALDGNADVYQRIEGDNLLSVACRALCETASGAFRLFDGGFPTINGVAATEVTDAETRFASAALALNVADGIECSESVHVYLCDSVTADTSAVPYAMAEQDGVTSVLLDVTDPHYKEQLTEILTMLQEGIQG